MDNQADNQASHHVNDSTMLRPKAVGCLVRFDPGGGGQRSARLLAECRDGCTVVVTSDIERVEQKD